MSESKLTKISKLIQLLEEVKKTHGDLDIAYWDQDQVVTFNDPTTVLQIDSDKNRLYFGGFHSNGDDFYDMEK